MLVPNPVYDPDPVPRYSVVDPANPVCIFHKEATYFDLETKTWFGKEHVGGWRIDKLTILPVVHAVRDAAAMVALSAWGGWLSSTQPVTMWEDTETARSMAEQTAATNTNVSVTADIVEVTWGLTGRTPGRSRLPVIVGP